MRAPDTATLNLREHAGRDARPIVADAATRATDGTEPLKLRTRATTAVGGLLFTLNLLEPLGILDALCDGPLREGRAMRFCLHQLALTLLRTEADDPAVLAFAGLAPDAEPPSALEPPPSEPERELFAQLGERITRTLTERLARPELSARELAALVFRRRAEIIADPAWIEAHFELGDVSIELRRAGLDLDPGWLPWLGAVVKFRYV